MSLLPPNATSLERALAGAMALLSTIPNPVRDLWNPWRCPLALLPWLAWCLGVEEWKPDWPEAVKRAACAEAFAIHRIKGTPAAVKRALRLVGAEFDYAERPGGVAMTALVRVYNSASIELDSLAEVRAALERVKRKSVHLSVELHAGLKGEVPVAGGLGSAQVLEFRSKY